MRSIDEIGDLGSDDGGRRIGAHAAGVGPRVAVEGGLVILGGDQRHGAGSVHQREEAGLFALHELLDHHFRAGVAEGAFDHDVVDGGERLVVVVADDHALARREPVGLDDDGRAMAVDEFLGRVRFVEPAVGGGRNAAPRAQVLHETLGALDLGRPRGRAEGEDPGVLEPVHQTGDQRRLGADDDEVDGVAFRVRDQSVDVLGGDVDACGHARDPGVARRAGQSRAQRRFRDRPAQRMFTSARSNDQHFHKTSPDHCARLAASTDLVHTRFRQ